MSLTKVSYSMITGAQVNVFDFGAVGDGSTNDTTAIANAIASLPATGGTVYFPKGTFITNVIVLPLHPKCVIFSGDGRETSVLKPLNANQKLIESAGITPNIGGTRFGMWHMGMMPHAGSSTGMAIDCRNISDSIFWDIAFLMNGTATFDIGFELYSQDFAPNVHCYYNTFKDIYIRATQASGNLPVKQAVKIFGSCGNHVFDHLTVSGVWPTTTRPAIDIASYCRHNIVMNSNFEGLLLSGTNTVVIDQSYGNYYWNNYFENTGQAYYFGGEVETGSREWSVVEKNAFAANTINSTTNSLVQGSTWRDNYAFGSDATVLAAIYQQETATRGRYNEYYEVSRIEAGLTKTSARLLKLLVANTENGILTFNATTDDKLISAVGASKLTLQGTATGGFVLFSCSTADVAGATVNYRNPMYLSYAGDAAGYSTANAAAYVAKNATSSRSINAAGTLNASGADYAEYMVKENAIEIAKGDICGINAQGKLTNVFADAVTFVVKSTNPSYVGGDNWFSEPQPTDDLDAHAEWMQRHEQARATVDRIAFAGQVPVNVTGAQPGDYIVPITANGGITGVAVTTPTFEQYQLAVGKVIAIEPDGRARIIVKVA